MGQLLSKVLRWQLVSAIDEGMSGCAAAARFGVVPSIAICWHTRRREAGVASRRPKGRDMRSHRVEVRQADIPSLWEAKRSITLE